jgi:hypothetical protein
MTVTFRCRFRRLLRRLWHSFRKIISESSVVEWAWISFVWHLTQYYFDLEKLGAKNTDNRVSNKKQSTEIAVASHWTFTVAYVTLISHWRHIEITRTRCEESCDNNGYDVNRMTVRTNLYILYWSKVWRCHDNYVSLLFSTPTRRNTSFSLV